MANPGQRILTNLLDNANAAINAMEQVVASNATQTPQQPGMVALAKVGTLINTYHRTAQSCFRNGILTFISRGKPPTFNPSQ